MLAIRDATCWTAALRLLQHLDQLDEELLVLTMHPERVDLSPNAVRWLRSSRVQHIELEALAPGDILESPVRASRSLSLASPTAHLSCSEIHSAEELDTLLSQNFIQLEAEHARLRAG